MKNSSLEDMIKELRRENASLRKMNDIALSNTEGVRLLSDHLGIREGKCLPGTVAREALDRIKHLEEAIFELLSSLKRIRSEHCFDEECVCCGHDGNLADEMLKKYNGQ